ncbi:phage minor head protein [Rhodoplanes sp. TEM]|uniref:Phage minor head protein n=1 Tax=Rhodoplanes tepidamans TaxID=200616 RepID=A0ABT5JCC9_RHOTP|nr:MULTISPECIES: phage minor head protein [Rhodoplanes]MDC7787351.1 phage minor head protein [Rhodoplanes tepidamans]MDC7984767.1 phage minor head protein [Rhodoplanes sp. TEM]MDQ0358262.1 hypothetical protein [Rhodoplanes tepidamans]
MMRPTRRQVLGLIAALAGTIERGMAAPPEVLSFFRDKSLTPKFSWLDVWGEEHAHAFTVAGVTEAKVLAQFQASIDKAIVEGWGFEHFREEMQKRLSPRGWWGPRQVEDPEGRWRTKPVDFSAPRRLQTTFWANMRAARAAGQWDRIQRTKRALPYLLYVRSVSERKRPDHLRWVGTILPVDHPFWSSHFPPNGWGCKCSVRSITAEERDDYLSRPASDAPGAISYTDEPPPTVTRTFVNRRTGERAEVPVGIDPGWQTNPGIGRGRTLGRILADQVDATPLDLARGRIERLTDSEGFRSFLWRAQEQGARRAALQQAGASRTAIEAAAPWSHSPVPVARLSDDVAAKLGVTNPAVTITDAAVGHSPAHHYPDWVWSRLQEMVESGAIYRRRHDGRYLVVGEVAGRTMMLVLAEVPGDRCGVVTLFQVPQRYLAKALADADRVG